MDSSNAVSKSRKSQAPAKAGLKAKPPKQRDEPVSDPASVNDQTRPPDADVRRELEEETQQFNYDPNRFEGYIDDLSEEEILAFMTEHGRVKGLAAQATATPTLPLVSVTLRLIAEHCLDLPNDYADGNQRVDSGVSSSSLASKLTDLQHVRLHELRIGDLGKIDALANVTHLYLHRNQIVDLEPLESLVHLTFLSLFRNCVTTLTSLSHLDTLRALDVSHNAIATAQGPVLPKGMLFLSMHHNPISMHFEYRADLVRKLPQLRLLDHVDVTAAELEWLGLSASRLEVATPAAESRRSAKERSKRQATVGGGSAAESLADLAAKNEGWDPEFAEEMDEMLEAFRRVRSTTVEKMRRRMEQAQLEHEQRCSALMQSIPATVAACRGIDITACGGGSGGSRSRSPSAVDEDSMEQQEQVG